MTIVKRAAQFDGNKVRNISTDAQIELANAGLLTSDLQILSAYLCITGQKLSIEHLRRRPFNSTIMGYLGALYSSKFACTTPNVAYKRGTALIAALQNLSSEQIAPKLSATSIPDNLLKHVEAFERASLCEEEVVRWQGWCVTSLKGERRYLQLDNVYESFGPTFTRALYEACAEYQNVRRGSTLATVKYMAEFLASGKTSWVSWKDPEEIDRCIAELGQAVFRRAHKKGNQLRGLAKLWNQEMKAILFSLMGKKVIAQPKAPFPKVRLGTTNEISERGSTLLSEHIWKRLPMGGLSDRELKQHLERELTLAMTEIERWAVAESNDLWERRELSLSLAHAGKSRTLPGDVGSKKVAIRLKKDCVQWIADCSATFERYGHALYRYGGTSSQAVVTTYAGRAREVLHALGLPRSGELLPFAVILVIRNPVLTTAMLSSITVVEKRGGNALPLHGDNKTQITVLKIRRGPESAEVDIALDEVTSEVLHRVLKLTDPYRDYLKAAGDPNWKKLFIVTPGLMSRPKPEDFSAATSRKNHVTSIATRLKRHTKIPVREIPELASKFSLRTLRATAGVLVYLKSGSVERMSAALGHKQYSADLLNKYLPKAIRALVEDYWIREFQLSLIAHATKGQAIAHIALSGLSEAEIESLISTTKMPAYRSQTSRSVRSTKLLIDICSANMTALIKLERKVAAEPTKATSDEAYFASFAKSVVALIACTKTQPALQDILAESLAKADADV